MMLHLSALRRETSMEAGRQSATESPGFDAAPSARPRSRCHSSIHPSTVIVRGLAVLTAALAGCLSAAAESAETETGTLEDRLIARLEANPDSATTWRLLGRLQLEHGEPQEALVSLRRATSLDPMNAAAAFDLARALSVIDEHAEAEQLLLRVQELAPDSEYAEQAMALLGEQIAPSGAGDVIQAGYETRRFDGTDRIKDRLPLEESVDQQQTPDYFVFMELGAQYNSNVGLTPLSRGLFPGNRDSFQAILAPEFEVNLFNRETVRAGAGFAGDFTLNEGNFRAFNLQSYRPGAFIEWDLEQDRALIIPRIDYQFGLDELDTATFATRHQVTTSAVALWSPDAATISYWSIDNTDFRNDGTVPWITSRDGVTNALGVTHELFIRRRWLRSARCGLQVEHADTTGADFRFGGIELNGGATIPLTTTTEVRLRGGWGIRNYPDFKTGPARNEHILSAGAEARHSIAEHITVAAVFAYDRFVSDNVLYDTDRVIGGLLMVFER